MILTDTNLGKYGMRLEANVDAPIVEGAIRDAEMQVVKPILGNAVYNECREKAESSTLNDAILDGGKFEKDGVVTYIGGLRVAIANIAFAFILRNKVLATKGGSVLKVTEVSQNLDERGYAKGNYAIGLNYLYEVCEVLGIERGESQINLWSI